MIYEIRIGQREASRYGRGTMFLPAGKRVTSGINNPGINNPKSLIIDEFE